MDYKLSSKASGKAKQQGEKNPTAINKKGILKKNNQLWLSEKKQEDCKWWKVNCENIWEQAKKKSEK